MKNKLMKSRMLLLILWMGAMIFIFSFSALFYPSYYPKKELDFLSDYYTQFLFQDENPDIQTILEIMEKQTAYPYLFVKYDWSNGKAINLSSELYQALRIDENSIPQWKQNDDVALVNLNMKNMCFEEAGEPYLQVGDGIYKVIGFYRDEKDDSLEETPYFINIYANSFQSEKQYDSLIVDFGTEINRQKNLQIVLKNFPNAQMYHWTGDVSGRMDARPAFVMVITLCGIVVCFNCIGFVVTWIQSFFFEFEVRKMVGGDDRSNHKLLLKHYASLLGIVCVAAAVSSEVIYVVIRHIPFLRSTRALFGTSLHVIPYVFAMISTFLISFIATEITFRKLRGARK